MAKEITAEVVSVGDELLIGQTMNTNAGWLGEQLTLAGIRLRRIRTIGDDETEILDALGSVGSHIVLITGGLGPAQGHDLRHGRMPGIDLITKYFPEITAQQRLRFGQLGELYAHWNERVNLISRKDCEHLYERHVLHSLGIARVVLFKRGTRIIDVGTGGDAFRLAKLRPDLADVSALENRILRVGNEVDAWNFATTIQGSNARALYQHALSCSNSHLSPAVLAEFAALADSQDAQESDQPDDEAEGAVADAPAP